MNRQIPEIFISEVEQNLKKKLRNRLKKIFLYGSYARGDYGKDSDIDFLVLTDLNSNEISNYRDFITDLTVELSIKYGKLASIVLKNETDFESCLTFLPYYKNVVNEGKVIYG